MEFGDILSMAMVECQKCGNKWNTGGHKPKKCPNCHDEEWWEESKCALGNVFIYQCNLCGYEWQSDLVNPKRCPKCDTIRWDSQAIKDGVCECQRCGHHWTPRRKINNSIKRCPKCDTRQWNTAKKTGPP